MREAKCMREVHKQHYACALKIASEQRATDFKPGISETAKLHQGTFPPEHASSFCRTAPWGARSFPNLPTCGAGGNSTLCASCKLATTHAPVRKSIASDAR